MKRKIAISIGDLNGVGFEIALKSHDIIATDFQPIYFLSREMAEQGAEILKTELPKDFQTFDFDKSFEIQKGKISAESGKYSFDSFKNGVDFVKNGGAEAIVTLPISKEAWHLAGIRYSGHTDALRDFFKADAIMMMGTPEMYVLLFTEHIPLKKVIENIKTEKLEQFLENVISEIGKDEKIGVLGVNPHAGDGGVLGDEESEIYKAINSVNSKIAKNVFSNPLVPDVAFTKSMRSQYRFFVAMYHDQGLAPLKALYFDEVINVSLNLPIRRVSVGHGTAFDIAYKGIANNKSYLNSIAYLK
ncbi:pyridoxal phosphate biosynthesis protein [Thiovulum sp. ES]|nr:pyridoxal phosphate biosynthesis protein [Thiovulum sp. ES]